MAAISKEIREMSLQPWFPIMMRELGYEPTKHGRWIMWGKASIAHCSLCETQVRMYDGFEKDWHYCPNCGARMDEPAPKAAELINDGTYSAGNLYECDPEKNTECRKTGCYINGGECRHTTHAEYVKEDQE